MSRRRGPPYGADLRERVLAAADASIRSVAARFSVSPSCVSKVRARVAEQADATIAELRAWLAQAHDLAVSHAVMWEALGRLGLTLKKSAFARPSRIAPTSPRRAPRGLPCSPSSTPAG